MKLVLASDHGGINLRTEIGNLLSEMGVDFDDMGCDCEDSVDYPDYGIPAAEKVANGDYDLGILICGTGIGMTIAANKVKGIRCALVHDVFSAKMTKAHNNANVIAMGERVIGPGLAREIVKAWLEAEFEGGRHENRIGKIAEYENK
ncbi:ribose 5-phosphate isomerase B [Salinibacillus xinjiangensis]|uniref:Ribose 5-phosphate isomerase B n=1 Tax=Salinibacillus xinjiangensis TaxID=1229268 RepID=A0A6G1X5W8_9BACI|nr:ribose 5-phosphate isomerase B [Salinibacillus xinjiangensis]MRG86208.1 ribose 5-phosphate isomerase B [Salinibacillus xinjiangensis]